MSKLNRYSSERLERAVALIDVELAPLIAMRRVAAPCAVRAGIIRDLSDERALYLAELNRRQDQGA